MPTIRITRIAAARRQLTTALELWFAEKDPVSVHSLVSAAHQIIHDLNRNAGGPELLFDSSVIKPESKKAVVAMLKKNMNFFKLFIMLSLILHPIQQERQFKIYR